MRKAILSDVHGNLPALRFVLEDLCCQAVDEVIYLGDIFSCEPGMAEYDIRCLDLLMELSDLALLGNRDLAVILNDADQNAEFPGTHFLYQKLCENTPENIRRWEFLNGLDRIYTQPENGTMFFHGSPRFPLHGYVGKNDIYDPRAAAYEFRMIHYLGIHGHTHCQDVISSELKEVKPNGVGELEWIFEKFPAEPPMKYFIGVGSVGDPRGRNAKMGYAIFEENDTFYRMCFRQFEPIEME